MNLPNQRVDHVFAIVRIDAGEAEWPIEDRITVVKVVLTEADAKDETEGLNNLNAEKGCRYIWQLTRLQCHADTA